MKRSKFIKATGRVRDVRAGNLGEQDAPVSLRRRLLLDTGFGRWWVTAYMARNLVVCFFFGPLNYKKLRKQAVSKGGTCDALAQTEKGRGRA